MYSAGRPPRHREVGSIKPTTDGFRIDKYNRFWQVLDPKGELVCLTVYKRGAKEVVRRLSG